MPAQDQTPPADVRTAGEDETPGRDRALTQRDTPYVDAVIRYRELGFVPFHTPGHKIGKGASERLIEAIGLRALQADAVPQAGIEDSRETTGHIREAERLAAEAYGGDDAWFLVNGSTSGVHALALFFGRPDEPLIVPRNSHKSLLAGIVFSGAVPFYVEPDIDPGWQIPLGMTAASVAKATTECPGATAVFTSSPNYYGVGADLEGMAAAAHAAGLPFVVDQAWGPHLRFCDALPADAMAAGADAAVNSTHKLIAGLTQASIVVARGERVNLKRLSGIIKMTQSTSRLALIFASIDASRQQMAVHGDELWRDAIELSHWGRRRIREIPGMRILGEEILELAGAHEFDPTRYTLTARDVGLSGYELETILRDDYRVAVEMAEPINVMFNITHGDSKESVGTLVDALADIAARFRGKEPSPLLERAAALQFPRFTRQVVSPRTAFYAASDVVATKDAVGRVGAEILTPYPPGIPALGPGEEVSQEIVDYLLAAAEVGVRVQGAEDGSLQTLRVVAE